MLHWRYLILAVFAAALVGAALWSGWLSEREPGYRPVGAGLGGVASRAPAGADSFRLPPTNLAPVDLDRFFAGQRLFNLAWVAAPSPVADADGLGPTFNRNACGRCHLLNGRGQAPATSDDPMLTMLVRIGVAGRDRHGGPRPHRVYGDQIQDRAIPGVAREGRGALVWKTETGRYGDGTAFTLRVPVVLLKDMSFGPAGIGIRHSLRVAPHLIGLGLLEAVSEAEILMRADPDDADKDGISGRANRVHDAETGKRVLGRFGWKAGQPTIRQQTARALSADMGLTTKSYPVENCPPAQIACRAAPNGGTPEVSERQLGLLADYVRLLVVPRRRDIDDPAVKRGEAHFMRIGCAACHRPTLKTAPNKRLPALGEQTIHAYTDLLLHDMGPGLADGFDEFAASGHEWRTPPLWGIGLFETVNKHTYYLHDGRARSLAEAILWHGGEAKRARDAFRGLAKPDRDALIAFLRSL